MASRYGHATEAAQSYRLFPNDMMQTHCGPQVNTVQPVWSMSQTDISEEMYDSFYKHVSKGFDTPTYRLHFTSDAPVDLKALFYVGEMSREKFGQGIQPSGVSLYSHKVLIEPESKILPQWLRFIFGVVDSEDIPLNISRESMQDSALLQVRRPRRPLNAITPAPLTVCIMRPVWPTAHPLRADTSLPAVPGLGGKARRGKVQQVLQGVWPVHQGGHLHRPGIPGGLCQAATLRVLGVACG